MLAVEDVSSQLPTLAAEPSAMSLSVKALSF